MLSNPAPQGFLVRKPKGLMPTKATLGTKKKKKKTPPQHLFYLLVWYLSFLSYF